MLRSSQFVHPKRAVEEPAQTPPSPRSLALRRTRSTESFASSQLTLSMDNDLAPPQAAFMGGQVSAHHNSSFASPSTPRKASGHVRGASIGSPGIKSRSQVNLFASSSVLDLSAGGKAKPAPFSKTTSPVKIISALSGISSLQIDVENIKKLRLLLRNESAS